MRCGGRCGASTRVFHVAGSTNLRASADALFEANVVTTRMLLEECVRAEVERVVHTSSVAAVGPAPTGGTADERQLWRGGDGIPYVDAKHEAEVEALRIAARGLPVVVVCPAYVLGAGDYGRSSTEIVRRFMLRRIPAYVEGAINVVDVEDVAAGMLLADERGVPGERYILGNRNYTWDRLFADLARLSGIEPPALRLPVPGRARAGGGARARARADAGHAGRGAQRGEVVDLPLDQGAARAGVDDAAARGDRRGDGQLVPRARGRAAGAQRDAAGAALARGGVRGAADRRAGAVSEATLHRCRTPTNWLCPCGRVARELASRGIETETVRVAWRARDRDEIDELTGQRKVPVRRARARGDRRLEADRRAPQVARGANPLRPRAHAASRSAPGGKRSSSSRMTMPWANAKSARARSGSSPAAAITGAAALASAPGVRRSRGRRPWNIRR